MIVKERVISAVIALLITVPLILLGGVYFKVLVILLGIYALYELLRLKKNIPSVMKYISYVLYVVLLLYGYIFTNGVFVLNASLLIIVFMVLFLSLIYYHNNKKYNIEDVFYLLSSIVFLSSAFNLFVVVREMSLMLVIYLFLVTTLTDTFAYIIGSKYGKKKLIPSISPNKTIEGSIGGVIAGVSVGSIFYMTMIGGNIFVVILMTLLLSILGQCGDLVFSQIKRYFGIKDFSKLMPGHGGVLDRLDSMIFVLFGYVIISIIL